MGASLTQQLGNEDYSTCKFITGHETGFKPAPSGWQWLKLTHSTTYFYPCIFMNNSSRKLHFLAHIYLWCDPEARLLYVWEGSTFHNLPGRKCERFPGAAAYLPVTWSTRMREVIMRPYCEKSCSNSFWVIVFGSPLTYKFASLIEAELGRA